jgi:phosphate/sulfate permease
MLIALLFLAALALAFALGGSLRSRRVAGTMAHKITTVGNGQGLLANSIASSLVIEASLLGSPVSTPHVWARAPSVAQTPRAENRTGRDDEIVAARLLH